MSASKSATRTSERIRGIFEQEEIEDLAINKLAFARSFEKAERTARQRLESFLEDPSQDAVHDARTAIRRLEANIDLLPKRIRKSSEAKELLKRHDKAMKKLAGVRDLDVIRERVLHYGNDPAKPELLKRIERARKKLLRGTKSAVADACKVRVRSGGLGLTQPKLQKRLEKVVARLAANIDELMPIVAGDPKKVRELHLLRIDGKKLRYTLELAMDAKSPQIGRLEKWQDVLGSIHDHDVIAAFLARFKSPFAREVLQQVVSERKREFAAFEKSVLNEAT